MPVKQTSAICRYNSNTFDSIINAHIKQNENELNNDDQIC